MQRNEFAARPLAGLHTTRNEDLIIGARETLEQDGWYGRRRASTMLSLVDRDGTDTKDVAEATRRALETPPAAAPASTVERAITALSLCLVFYGAEPCV